jgi:hypothetical protein
MSGEHSVYAMRRSFPDGKETAVWMVHDLREINGVLGCLRPIEKNDLQIVPAPPGFEWGYHFIPGHNIYGVIDAGYHCPKCRTPVKGGLGTTPFLHRFDFRRCLMALRHPESDWNGPLTRLQLWEFCTQAVIEARKDAELG